MLSAIARPLFQFPYQSSGESFSPSTSTSNLRRPRAAVVSAAYASATAGQSGRAATSAYVKQAAPSCFYEVLGIPVGATNNEIKAAYRRLARICHPDVAAIDEKGSSAAEFMKVHAAYSTLADPDKRADYDRRLFRDRRGARLYSRPSTTTFSRFSGYSSRKWETDQCW